MGRDLKCCECGYEAHEDTFREYRESIHYRFCSDFEPWLDEIVCGLCINNRKECYNCNELTHDYVKFNTAYGKRRICKKCIKTSVELLKCLEDDDNVIGKIDECLSLLTKHDN